MKKVFVFGVCLLLCQATYAGESFSRCRDLFTKFLGKSYLVDSIRSTSKADPSKLPKDFIPTHVYGPTLRSNDLASIREALSVQEGDGAVIVNINPFTLEIAKKMRQAIYDTFAFLKSTEDSYPNNRIPWGDLKALLQDNTKIISPEELGQFQKELDEYIEQVRQMILQVDGQQIELSAFQIGIDTEGFVPGHKHYEKGRLPFPFTRLGPKPSYITTSIAPIGYGTFYTKQNDLFGDRIVPEQGQTVVLSERDRVGTLKEHGHLPFHGTPLIHYPGKVEVLSRDEITGDVSVSSSDSKERFFLLFQFKRLE